MISSAFPYSKQRLPVFGSEMAYVDVGAGDPIIFLHGNPTSSYVWRNVIPHLERLGRCIAPDLIGMGDSAKLPHSGPGSYRFVTHRRYLDALLDRLGVRERVVLVVHDWGSALGFDWANRHRDAVRGIVYLEALVAQATRSDWQKWAEHQPEAVLRLFQSLPSEAGERAVLEDNAFLETMLPLGVLRSLSEEEMAAYRRPFAEPGEGRRPTLDWPLQIPVDGQPADVSAIVASYGAWLAQSAVPKLFINGQPGAILTGAARDFCRTWPNQTEVTVPGIHFLQEDSPAEIGQTVADWLPAMRESHTA
jgi:haloalkane dehalogenase